MEKDTLYKFLDTSDVSIEKERKYMKMHVTYLSFELPRAYVTMLQCSLIFRIRIKIVSTCTKL